MTTTSRDFPCIACDRRVGDHTLDEWAACAPNESQPLEELSDDVRQMMGTLGLGGYQPADNVIVVFDFSVGHTLAIPTPTAQVAFMVPVDKMREFGQLVADAATSAASAAERAA